MKPLKKVTDLGANEVIHCKTKKEILNRIEKLEDQLLRQTWVIDEGTKGEAKQMFSNQIPIKPDYESFIGKKMIGFEFGNSNSFNLECVNFGKIGQIKQYCAITNQFRVVFNGKGYGYFYPADLAIRHIVEDTTTNLQVPVTDNEKEKVLLYLDMLEHSRSVNGDWLPNWEGCEDKHTLWIKLNKSVHTRPYTANNYSVFGIVYKTEESAEQAKEKFTERILKYYGN